MTEKRINGIKILHYVQADSTNRIALALGEAEHLCTVVADSQNGGRGRLGRSFFSPDGGLYMSVVLDPSAIVCGLPFCTAAAALAVKAALCDFGVGGISVKWVNDLLMDGKKVCGILTEARTENGNVNRAVIGIGINLKRPDGDFPEEIRKKAGAIGFESDKLELAAAITARLGEYLNQDSARIATLYEKSLAFIGKTAEVTDYADGQKKLRGVILGVDENCYLKLALESGEIRRVCSGEII